MFVVVCGAGRVGLSLAKKLVETGIDVTVIENDAGRCKEIGKDVDALIINGNAAEIEILEKANVKKANMVVAATGREETNLISCLLAKHINPRCKVFARIEHPQQSDVFRKLGIDEVIYPEIAAADYLSELINTPDLVDLAIIHRGGAEMLEVELKNGNKVTGKTLGELELPEGSLVVGIYEGDKIKIPTPDFVFRAGDRVLIIAKKNALDKVKKLF